MMFVEMILEKSKHPHRGMFVPAKRLAGIRTRRAGIIPYTLYEGNMYFLFGQDSRTGELTDFGGQSERSESSFTTATREFLEETNRLFLSTPINIDKSLAVVDPKRRMAIMFIPVPFKWVSLAPQLFDKRKMLASHKKYREIRSLVWVRDDELSNILDGNGVKMWSRVRNFLNVSIGNVPTLRAKLISILIFS